MNDLFTLEKAPVGYFISLARELTVNDLVKTRLQTKVDSYDFKTASTGNRYALSPVIVAALNELVAKLEEQRQWVSVDSLYFLIDRNGESVSLTQTETETVKYNGLKTEAAKIARFEQAISDVKVKFEAAESDFDLNAVSKFNNRMHEFIAGLNKLERDDIYQMVVKLNVQYEFFDENLPTSTQESIEALEKQKDSLRKKVAELEAQIEQNHKTIYESKRVFLEAEMIDAYGKQTQDTIMSLKEERPIKRKRLRR